jgi:hypothetical protein
MKRYKFEFEAEMGFTGGAFFRKDTPVDFTIIHGGNKIDEYVDISILNKNIDKLIEMGFMKEIQEDRNPDRKFSDCEIKPGAPFILTDIKSCPFESRKFKFGDKVVGCIVSEKENSKENSTEQRYAIFLEYCHLSSESCRIIDSNGRVWEMFVGHIESYNGENS